jgi:hypothetical protein
LKTFVLLNEKVILNFAGLLKQAKQPYYCLFLIVYLFSAALHNLNFALRKGKQAKQP